MPGPTRWQAITFIAALALVLAGLTLRNLGEPDPLPIPLPRDLSESESNTPTSDAAPPMQQIAAPPQNPKKAPIALKKPSRPAPSDPSRSVDEDVPNWENLHSPKSIQTRQQPAPYSAALWSVAHGVGVRLSLPFRKNRSQTKVPRASELTPEQLHEAYKEETGVRTLIGRFEEAHLLWRKDLEITRIAMGVPRDTAKDCVVRHHHVAEARRRWDNGRFVNFTTSLATKLSTVEEVEVGEKRLCIQPEDLSGKFTPQPFSDFINAKKLPLLDQAVSRAKFGYSYFPLYDGFSVKMLADFQYETDSWLFGPQHPDLFGFIKPANRRWFDRCLIYWHLEGKDLLTLKEHIHKFPGPFFLVTASLDDPDFPAWLLENPNVLKIFAVNVPISIKHPKIFVLPFGHRYTLGDIINEKRVNASIIKPTELMFSSFTIGARAAGYLPNKRTLRREKMMEELKKNWPDLSESTIHKKLTEEQYTEHLLRHKFILSPPGIGIDAYRTWQVLNVGRVPVVKALLGQELYDNLPVVVVQEWAHLTPRLLHDAWGEMNAIHFNLQKLYYPYWVREILRECLAVPKQLKSERRSPTTVLNTALKT